MANTLVHLTQNIWIWHVSSFAYKLFITLILGKQNKLKLIQLEMSSNNVGYGLVLMHSGIKGKVHVVKIIVIASAVALFKGPMTMESSVLHLIFF
jgi:hypothetical protein